MYANLIRGFRVQGLALLPDVVLLSVRPVELTKLLQSYQHVTGRPIQAHMNPLRAVDADLIARPYLTGEINISSYCLGARTLARFEGNRMGVGIPLAASERQLLLPVLPAAAGLRGRPTKSPFRFDTGRRCRP
jgi:uncharacterized protein (DUF169 family)